MGVPVNVTSTYKVGPGKAGAGLEQLRLNRCEQAIIRGTSLCWLFYTLCIFKKHGFDRRETDLLRYSTLSLTLIVLLALASNQVSISADLPMPADKSVAVPADPEATAAPAAAAPATAPASGTPPASTGTYAEEGLKHYNLSLIHI